MKEFVNIGILIPISFLFFHFSLLAQNEPFDPWEIELDSLQNWTVSRIQHRNYGTITFSFAHIGLTRARQTSDLEALGEAYYQLAEWHNYHYHVYPYQDSAVYYDKESIKVYEKLGDKQRLAESYNYLALDETAIGKQKEAEMASFKSLELYKELGNNLGIAKNYRTLTIIYLGLNDTTNAIKYGENAISFEEVYEDPIMAGLLHYNLARAYELAGKHDKVINNASKAISQFDKEPEEKVDAYEYYFSHEVRGNAYLSKKQFDKALADYQFALNTAKEYLGDSLSVEFNYNLGRAYRINGDYVQALPHLTQALDFLNKYEESIDTEGLLRELFLTNYYLGNYEEAFAYNEQVDSLTKQLVNQRIISLKSELEAKYESREKDQTIFTQQNEIQQRRTIQWLSIGIASLFALMLIGLFYFYRKNKQTSALLAEKAHQNEILLKEIHHRVKNNLQTISSLLGIQSASINNPEIQTAVAQSQHRVESIALIHQRLYQGEDLATVEIGDYLKILAHSIKDTFWDLTDRVDLAFDLDETELDVDNATPLGLIANELITNSFKYAFPDGKSGTIKIRFKKIGEDTFEFNVSDNGIGMNEDTPAPKSGFGSRLVRMLTEQIRGNIAVNTSNGMETSITFQYSNE